MSTLSIEPQNQLKVFTGTFDDDGNFTIGSEFTNKVAKIQLDLQENKVDTCNLTLANDVVYNPAPAILIGTAIQIQAYGSGKVLFIGMIVEDKPEISVNGSFITFKACAYPSVGLARMRCTETYNNVTLRQALIQPIINENDFPATEYYTEEPLGTIWSSSFSDGDWYVHRVGGVVGVVTIQSVSSFNSYTPREGSEFILLSSNTISGDENFEFPNYAWGGAHTSPFQYGLNIDDLARSILYNPFTNTWTNMPYLDFWIFVDCASTFNITLQLKITDVNYISMELTQNNLGFSFPFNQWNHFQIPVGSRWGEGQIYLNGSPTQNGVPIIDMLSWTMQEIREMLDFVPPVANFEDWNGINSINFYTSSATSAFNIGIDGLRIGTLNIENNPPTFSAGLGDLYGIISSDVKAFMHLTTSKYASLKTLIYNDTTTVLPYINAVYEPCIKALMDVMNLYSAAVYPNPSLHWITIPNSDGTSTFIIAPIGVDGTGLDDNGDAVDIGTIYPVWTQYGEGNPIILGSDLLSLNLRKQESEYNAIVINGVFQCPRMNSNFAVLGINNAESGWMPLSYWSYFATGTCALNNSTNVVVPPLSLCLNPIHCNTADIISGSVNLLDSLVVDAVRLDPIGYLASLGLAVTSGLTMGETVKLYINLVGGSGATAHAVVSGGVITSIVVDNGGRDYQSTTNPAGNNFGGYSPSIIEVQISDSTGEGASAYAQVENCAISSVVMINGGSGYTNPTITFIPQQNTATEVTSSTKLFKPVDLNLINNSVLEFWLQEVNLQTFEVRIYTDLEWSNNSGGGEVPDPSGDNLGSDDGQGDYFWQQITPIGTSDPSQGSWKKISLSLGPKGGWNITNAASWSKPIKRIYFRMVGGGGVNSRNGFVYISGLNINGNTLRMAYSSSQAYAFGAKVGLLNEVLVAGSIQTVGYQTNGKIDKTTLDALDLLSIQEVIREAFTPRTGTITIPVDYTVLAGQMIAVQSPAFATGYTDSYDAKALLTQNANYGIMQLRITHVQYQYIPNGGVLMHLQVSNDLTNSYIRDPLNEQTKLIKAIDPNYQDRNFARLAVAGINSQTIICKMIDVDQL